jgi:hypothetical protein
MSDEQTQAEALARWLEAGPDELPDPDMDAQVIESVVALRPEMAPPASLDIADLLARPEVEAMLAAGAEAPRLARWLSGEGRARALDRDVAETVHSLSPHLAPAPRVDIDQILSRVQSGPLAAPADVVLLRPRWRAWWGMGGGALLAAAAVAAIFLTTALPRRSETVPFAAAPSEVEPLVMPSEPVEAGAPALEAPSATPEPEDSSVRARPAVTLRAEKQAAASETKDDASGRFTFDSLGTGGAASGGGLGTLSVGGGSGFGAGSGGREQVVRSVERDAEEEARPAPPASVAEIAAPPVAAAPASEDAFKSLADSAEDLAAQVVPPATSGMRAAERACRAYLRSGEVSQAIAVAERGLALAPEAPRTLWLAYADALEAAGRTVDAQAARERAGR